MRRLGCFSADGQPLFSQKHLVNILLMKCVPGCAIHSRNDPQRYALGSSIARRSERKTSPRRREVQLCQTSVALNIPSLQF